MYVCITVYINVHTHAYVHHRRTKTTYTPPLLPYIRASISCTASNALRRLRVNMNYVETPGLFRLNANISFCGDEEEARPAG